MQGWKDGNYSSSKGIIFKASDSVEKGSTYTSKTFASYNRASYKPSLTVTYTTEASGVLGNGTYYINNRGIGKYLRKESSKATVATGYLSSLSSSIYWTLVKVSGGYVIRSTANPTIYLGVPANTSSTEVELVTVSDAAIPTRCIWTVSTATGGGYLIKSNYNSKYLYASGTSVYTTSTLGTTGTATYLSRAWRMVRTSSYGSTSSYSMREMSSTTYIKAYNGSVGATGTPTIVKGSSAETWCSLSDFTYSGYSTDIMSINALTGKITGKKAGTTMVTATHKVTGRVIKFSVTIAKLLIYQTKELYRTDAAGNLAEDLKYGDISESTLKSYSWINWSDFLGDVPTNCQVWWKKMSVELFSTGEMEDVILEMIEHFISGSGSDYSNSILTKNVRAHSDTQRYISDVKEQLTKLLNTYKGNITKLTYVASNRTNNPLVIAFKNNSIYQPVYNTTSDKINGLTICVDSLWGNKIEVTEYKTSGSTYTGTLHFTLYDHFGLDKTDVEGYGYLAGFRGWYILQHCSTYSGKYRPFVTKMEFDITFSGTY